ncbi:MAG: type 4a pilus biogenesis protein PilO [Proteobacteria bacterium]|nr:type 4a pilus biogenesis protein PilO [Pseudomonadota bacterium]
MKLSDFRNLDFNNIGGWAQGVKLTFCTLLFGLIVLAGWWFMISDQQDDLKQRQGQETGLRKEFSDKQAKVVNLDALKQQLDEMRDMLRQLLRQLPSKTEMPELLVDISQTALSAGLQTQLFQPGPESIKEGFYAEKPIQLRMMGTYHQFGAFISGVAALPRVVILTMHDVSLKPIAGTAGELSLEGTVRTYRYVEEDESGSAPKKPANQGGK